MRHDASESEFVRHVPCDCRGRRRSNSLYSDGHTYCFSCQTYNHAEGVGPLRNPPPRMAASVIQDLTYQDIHMRKLTEDSCRRWGYGIGQFRDDAVQVANYRSADGSKTIAQKVRTRNKVYFVTGDIERAGFLAIRDYLRASR
jgi:twinkle protein